MVSPSLEGRGVGFVRGAGDGSGVGSGVGSGLGSGVGSGEGTAVGSGVGTIVGSAVGSIVSPARDGRVVRAVGRLVGDGVGRSDGRADGLGQAGRISSLTVVGAPSSVHTRLRVGVGAEVEPSGMPQKQPSPHRTRQEHCTGTAGQPRLQAMYGSSATMEGAVTALMSSLVVAAHWGTTMTGAWLRPRDRARTDLRFEAARAPGRYFVGIRSALGLRERRVGTRGKAWLIGLGAGVGRIVLTLEGARVWIGVAVGPGGAQYDPVGDTVGPLGAGLGIAVGGAWALVLGSGVGSACAPTPPALVLGIGAGVGGKMVELLEVAVEFTGCPWASTRKTANASSNVTSDMTGGPSRRLCGPRESSSAPRRLTGQLSSQNQTHTAKRPRPQEETSQAPSPRSCFAAKIKARRRLARVAVLAGVGWPCFFKQFV